MIRRAPALGLLVAVSLASAVAVVEAKHQARQLQAQLQQLRTQREQIGIQRAKLQLEATAWGNPGRVSKIAHGRLDMHQPQDLVIVKGTP
ncbi:MAG: cell division protein FtsL [Salinisphaera sp.]|nr:cell division protein FtsL [Salinisphaera sp.]